MKNQGLDASSRIALGLCSLLVLGEYFFRAHNRKVSEQLTKRNGRYGIIEMVFQHIEMSDTISEKKLMKAYERLAKRRPSHQEIVHEIVRLGGSAMLDCQEKFHYCFAELAQEIRVLKKVRESAKIEETRLAKIIFTSKNKFQSQF